MTAHGRPRYTKDLDVWIESTPENAARVSAALKQFGFESLGLQDADFLTPDQVIQLGAAPNRIDILTSISGVEFTTCYEGRLTLIMDGVPIDFLGRVDLKKNKRATGRLQDLADVESLGEST